MPKISKRYKKITEGLSADAFVDLKEAIKMLKEKATVKFDETVDIAMNLGVDPKHADQMVRGVVAMPKGTGKTARVAVFARDKKADEAKAAGADIVGAEDLAEKVQKGEIDFDRIIATPDMMAVVGKLGKVLGPRGLMPNPKVGTVTPDTDKAVKNAKAGQVQYRTDKAGIIHCTIGRASFSVDHLQANLSALMGAINKAKPTGTKGIFIKKLSISSTMGAGIKIDQASLTF